MLITNGGHMYGTIFDDPGEKAMQLNIGDCLTFGSFVPSVDSSDLNIRLPMLWHVIGKDGNRLKLLSYFFFEHTGIGLWRAAQKQLPGKTRKSDLISTINSFMTALPKMNEAQY